MRRLLTITILLFMLSAFGAPATAGRLRFSGVKVYTRNFYVGADFDGIITAQTPSEVHRGCPTGPNGQRA